MSGLKRKNSKGWDPRTQETKRQADREQLAFRQSYRKQPSVVSRSPRHSALNKIVETPGATERLVPTLQSSAQPTVQTAPFLCFQPFLPFTPCLPLTHLPTYPTTHLPNYPTCQFANYQLPIANFQLPISSYQLPMMLTCAPHCTLAFQHVFLVTQPSLACITVPTHSRWFKPVRF